MSRLRAAADVAMMRASAKDLSAEMILLLCLVVEDGYLLFPSASERAACGSALVPAPDGEPSQLHPMTSRAVRGARGP